MAPRATPPHSSAPPPSEGACPDVPVTTYGMMGGCPGAEPWTETEGTVQRHIPVATQKEQTDYSGFNIRVHKKAGTSNHFDAHNNPQPAIHTL